MAAIFVNMVCLNLCIFPGCSWCCLLLFGVQIENEYGPEEKEFGAAGKSYSDWAAKMAVGLDTGVPWVMCKQEDAPDPVVC